MRDLDGLETKVVKRTMHMAVCWRIEATTGEVLTFTSCSRNLVIGGDTYFAVGIEPTAIQFSLGLSVSNAEITGFLNDDVLPSLKIRAGCYDGAQVYQFVVDYTAPDDGDLKLIWGTIGEISRKGNQFSAEIRGAEEQLSVPIVDTTQSTCRNSFGDAATCKATVHTNTGTVTTAGQKQFIAAGLASARADGFFNFGYLKWLTGANAGLKMDMRQYTSTSGTFLMGVTAVLTIVNGDTFTVYEGCLKTEAACKTKTGPGGVNNIINFNGEPNMPGNDELLRIVRAT